MLILVSQLNINSFFRFFDCFLDLIASQLILHKIRLIFRVFLGLVVIVLFRILLLLITGFLFLLQLLFE